MDKEFKIYLESLTVTDLIDILFPDGSKMWNPSNHRVDMIKDHPDISNMYNDFGDISCNRGDIYLMQQDMYTSRVILPLVACSLKAFKLGGELLYVADNRIANDVISECRKFVSESKDNRCSIVIPLIRVLMDNITFVHYDYEKSLNYIKGKPQLYFLGFDWFSFSESIKLYKKITCDIPARYTMVNYKSNDDFEMLYDVVTELSRYKFNLNISPRLDRNLFTFKIPQKVTYKVKVDGGNLAYILKNLVQVGRKKKSLEHV